MIPEDLMVALQTYSDDNAARNRVLAVELCAVVGDLRREGIPALPFKGPTLAKAVYGDIALRAAGDLDFLVRPEDVDRTRAVLARRGYRPHGGDEPALSPAIAAALRRVENECVLVGGKDGFVLEPHWALVPSTLAMDIDYRGLWDRATTIALDEGEVAALSIEDLVFVLCVHGSKHQWLELRWIQDVAELIVRYPGLDWDACLDRARRQGCERMVLLGLALASETFEIALPAPISTRPDADADALARRSREQLFAGNVKMPDPYRVTRYSLRMRERRRDRIAYVWRTLVTPREKHYALVKLPVPLRFLYPAIKLVHDYLMLPLWHRLPAAAVAEETRDRVRADWTARAEDWDRWSDEAAGSAARVNAALIAAVDISPDHRVLDLASGVGEPSLDIARRLDGEGRVVASDFVPAMLETTRRRATVAGVTGLDCCAADMEALPFAGEVFDRVVCRFGITFCPRPERALAHAFRVLRPGGRAAFLVWGRLDENTIFQVLQRIVEQAVPVGAGRGPFRFGATDDLSRAMNACGFADVKISEVRFVETIAPDRRFWGPTFDMAFGAAIRPLTPAAQAALERAIEAAFADHLRADGYRIGNHLRVVVGTRR